MQMSAYRKTFVFDSTAMRHLRSLASAWGVSQAETVRRALSKTVRSEISDMMADDPLSILAEYHKSGGLASVKADEYLRQVRRDRVMNFCAGR